MSIAPPKHSTPETKRSQDVRKRYTPFDEILGDLRQVGEFSPSRQHEHVANGKPHNQRPGPGKKRRNLRRQQNEEIDNQLHETLPKYYDAAKSTAAPGPGTITDLQSDFASTGPVVTVPYPEILQGREGFQQPNADRRDATGQKADAGDNHQHAHDALYGRQMPLHPRKQRRELFDHEGGDQKGNPEACGIDREQAGALRDRRLCRRHREDGRQDGPMQGVQPNANASPIT